MKKLLLFVAISIVAFSFNSCGNEFFQDRPVASNELMNPIKDFITNYFPDCTIVKADMDSELTGVTYDVDLSCGVELEFNSKGEWICVDCGINKVPDDVIPSAILTYLNKQYSELFIVHIDKNMNGYEVELNNGYELYFNKNGEYLRIDF